MKTLMQWSLSLMLALPLAAGAALSRPATPFTDAELDQLLAPIALYPDTVLSHVLIAATVPEEVEEAADWSNRHPDLRGQAAVDAVARMDWDPSVKALVAFPEILEQMQEDPEWTENLGEAFLEQEAVVMDRVQYLRDRADASGNLESTEHVRVVREREYIYIEPAVSHFVYVPYYDPWYVYGSWWWPSYPPHRWAYWGGYPARHYYGSPFFWGIGFHLGPSYYYGRFNWAARHVVVTRPHRHFAPDRRYAPSVGYSGRSEVRRQRHVPNGDIRRDRRGHDRRRDEPARSGRAERHSPQVRESGPQRGREHRRNSSDVQRELAARREHPRSAPRANSTERHRPGGEARGWSEQRPRHEASPRAPERSHERAETRESPRANRSNQRPAPPAERALERTQDRDTSRSDRGASLGRHNPQRAPEARAGGRERGGQHRQNGNGNGRGRSER